MELRLGEWDHAQFDHLSHALHVAKGSRTQNAATELHRQLEAARPWIVRLSNVPGPSDAAGQAIAKNPTIIPDGKPETLAGAALVQVGDIAKVLDISQEIAATLYRQVAEEQARFPGLSEIHIAITIYLNWLNNMLDFLNDLLRSTIAVDADDENAVPSHPAFLALVGEILNDETHGAGGPLVMQLLHRIDDSRVKIRQLREGFGPHLPGDLFEQMVCTYRVQQDKMARVLGVICEHGQLYKKRALAVLRWLKKQAKVDGVVSAVAMAFYTAAPAVDTLGENDPREVTSQSWARDEKVMKLFTKTILQEHWANPDLRACTKLVWITFYQSHFHIVPAMGFDYAKLDQLISEAPTEKAFDFLLLAIQLMRIDRGSEADPRGLAGIDLAAERSDGTNDSYILERVQHIVDGLAVRSKFVRLLRSKEDDRRGGQPVYQQYLSLVAALYRELPKDAAELLWDVTDFTSVVLDHRNATYLTPAACDMFAAIAKGPRCAQKCYHALRSSKDWVVQYAKALQHVISTTTAIYDSRAQQHGNNGGTAAQGQMQQQQETQAAEHNYEALQGWLQVLATITTYSWDARNALQQLRPDSIHTLFDLLNHGVPISLKVEALNILSTYAEDEEQQPRLVEMYQRVTPIFEARGDSSEPPATWVSRHHDEQGRERRFPLVAAHFRFLTAIMAVSPAKAGAQAVQQRAIALAVEWAGKIPAAIEGISIKNDRDELCDSIVEFLETTIQSVAPRLDVVALRNEPSLAKAVSDIRQTAGFEVILQTLSDSKVLDGLSKYLETLCAEQRHGTSLLTLLRVFYRLLQTQAVFFDVVLGTLERQGQFTRPHTLRQLDEYLIVHHPIVIRVAMLVNVTGEAKDEIGLVAIKFIQALTDTPMFGAGDRFGDDYHFRVNRLAGLLESSDYSIQIAQAFLQRLEADGVAMTEEQVGRTVETVLAGIFEETAGQDLGIPIRSTILDMLVGGAQDVSEPNVAHFLLGFDFKHAHLGLAAAGSGGQRVAGRVSCLDVLLEQLKSYITDDHPVLAAKQAQLVYQLFANPAYGQQVIRYAAERDYAVDQLIDLPERPAETDTLGYPGWQGYRHSVQVHDDTTAEATLAFIRFYQFVLSAVALDVFSSNGDGPGCDKMAYYLFEPRVYADRTRQPLLIELLGIIDMTWEEPDLLQDAGGVDLFANFDYDRYKSAELDWWNVDDMAVALRAAVPPQDWQKAEAEVQRVLATFAQANRATDVLLAQGAFLATYSTMLKVTLQMLSRHVEDDQREIVYFDLLDAIALRLSGDMDTPGAVEILAESMLALVTVLVPILHAYDGTNVPIDRCTDVLCNMLDLVSRTGMNETARGNIYAAINLYLSLLTHSSAQVNDNATEASYATRLTAQTALSANTTYTTGITTPSLHRETISAIDGRKDRFFGTLCRDAIEMRDVWKTECYSLLGALVSVCRSDKDRGILQPLVKGRYLTSIVRSVKEQELAVRECLEPNPPEPHALWVHEAKMAFLLATASTRRGAEQLLNAGVFDILSTLSFVNAQIITREVMADEGYYSVVKMQHETVLGVLQLCIRILGSLGTGRGVAEQAISFLNSHKEALLLLLRESQNSLTLIGIEETRLIVSLLGLVAPKIPSDDLTSPSGMGGFHLAVLTAAARCFGGDWTQALVDPEEEEQATIDIVQLNHAILTYLCTTTTGLKSGHGQPVLVTGAQRSAHHNTRYITSAPSLQDVVDLVQSCGERARQVEEDHDKVLMRFQAGNADLLEEEVAAMRSGVLSVDDEGVADISDALDQLVQYSQMLQNMIESLLLLLWRHLLFYANEAGNNNVHPRNLSSSLAYSTQMGSTRGASRDTLNRVAMSLGGVMDAINVDRQVPEELRPDGSQGGEYRRILVRRLREMITALTDA